MSGEPKRLHFRDGAKQLLQLSPTKDGLHPCVRFGELRNGLSVIHYRKYRETSGGIAVPTRYGICLSIADYFTAHRRLKHYLDETPELLIAAGLSAP